MASISDSAGIFTGTVLDAFNQMESVVARDGDVAFAQTEMQAAMRKVIATKGSFSGSGSTVGSR